MAKININDEKMIISFIMNAHIITIEYRAVAIAYILLSAVLRFFYLCRLFWLFRDCAVSK